MQITYNDITAFLSILVLVMTAVLLYHAIVLALNLRRITKRADRVSKELESVVMKPLTAADSAMTWVMSFLEGWHGEKAGKKHHKGKKTDEFDVVDV